MKVDVGEFGNAPELLQPKHEGQSRIKDKGLSALYLGTCFSAGLTICLPTLTGLPTGLTHTFPIRLIYTTVEW